MQRSCWRNGRRVGVTVLGLVSACLWGCGGSAEKPAVAEQAANKPAGESASPAEAVRSFLQAIKTGDEKTADQMLTKLARIKTQEADLHVAPPGSDTAKFDVGEQEIEADGAQVYSTWTDVDDDGQPHTDKIVWILRKEPEGWRIAGMATELFPKEEPLVLNFEDPEDMVAKQQKAEEEMIRRAQATIQQAAQPDAKKKPAPK